jgi:hypothetical protein
MSEELTPHQQHYHAYTIYDVELGCGCEECCYHDVYDAGGNNYEKFCTHTEAKTAARKQMIKLGHDRFNVIGPIDR